MWSNITGQDKVKEKLKSIYKSGKIGHAFIFHGIEGIGKDAAAIEFAKLLNCKNPVNNEACDICDNCKKISKLRSELFNVVCAIPAGRSDSDSDPIEKLSLADFDNYLEQIELKSRNPYHRINIPNANNIRIDSIRELVNKIYLSSGKFTKVFLITEADKMKAEAANALLKVLEEPPKQSVLILTTSKLNSLLQTIIGRCQKIFFEPLPDNLVEKKLAETSEKEINSLDLRLASKLSGGSYSRANGLLESNIREIRETAILFLVSILKNDLAEVTAIVRSFTSKSDKERLKNFFLFLTIWFRDVMSAQQMCKELITNQDKADRIIKFSQNYSEANIFSIIIAIEEAERELIQNMQVQLVMFNLAFRLKELIGKSKG